MIRIRTATGQEVPVPAGQFVEICSDDGAVGMVFFQSAPGTIIQVVPGSQDAARYEDMFRSCGVEFNKMLVHRRS